MKKVEQLDLDLVNYQSLDQAKDADEKWLENNEKKWKNWVE